MVARNSLSPILDQNAAYVLPLRVLHWHTHGCFTRAYTCLPVDAVFSPLIARRNRMLFFGGAGA